MQYRDLGRTGLKVSVASYGSGGHSLLSQNAGMSFKDQNALIRRCLDLGINFFDTSAIYNESEVILGKALSEVPRDSYMMATKWHHAAGGELAADGAPLAASVEKSLQRLATDHIDIIQFHGLHVHEYHEAVKRFYPTMKQLQQDGKVRFIGFSEPYPGNSDPKQETTALALSTHPELWDTIMIKYGIINQLAAKEALPLAEKHGVGILNMAAVRLKLTRPDQLAELMADWKRSGLIPADSLPEKDPLGWLVHDGVDSVVSAGYKFAADHSAVSTVITGTANIDHLEKNVAALEKPSLPEADHRRLVELFSEITEGEDE